jgi:hypothetical protein
VFFLDASQYDVKTCSRSSVGIPRKSHTLCQNANSSQKHDIYEIEPALFYGEEELLEHIIQFAEGYPVKVGKRE